MSIPKLLVVEDDLSWRSKICTQLELQGCFQINTASDGLAAKRFIANHHPEALVLDLVLPGLDGIGLLHHIRKTMPDYTPFVQIISAIGSFDTLHELQKLSISSVLLRPIEVRTAIDRLMQNYENWLKLSHPHSRPTSVSNVQQLLTRLGVSPTLHSSLYTIYALELCLSQPAVIGRMTKELYPAVAHHFRTSSGAVEHGIRYCKQAVLSQKTPLTHWIFSPKFQYSNSEFLHRLLNYSHQQ